MWNKYDNDRVYKIENDILVIKPKDKEHIIPLFCPVCSFAMKSSDDFLSYKEYSCCYKCNIYLVSKRKEEWKSGWRPDLNSKEMKDYLEFRKETFKPIIRFS